MLDLEGGGMISRRRRYLAETRWDQENPAEKVALQIESGDKPYCETLEHSKLEAQGTLTTNTYSIWDLAYTESSEWHRHAIYFERIPIKCECGVIMKSVILEGGLGTRISEETNLKPSQ